MGLCFHSNPGWVGFYHAPLKSVIIVSASISARSQMCFTWSKSRHHSRSHSRKSNSVIKKRHSFLNKPRALQYVYAAGLNVTFGKVKCIGPCYLKYQCKIIIIYSHKNITERQRECLAKSQPGVKWKKQTKKQKQVEPKNTYYSLTVFELCTFRRSLVFQTSHSVNAPTLLPSRDRYNTLLMLHQPTEAVRSSVGKGKKANKV